MSNDMKNLYAYILNEFSMSFETRFTRDLLYNILHESESIECVSERCEYLNRILPQITLTELRDILLR